MKVVVAQEVLPPVPAPRPGIEANAKELRAEMERIWHRGITDTEAAMYRSAWLYVGSAEEARAIAKGEIDRLADDYLIKRVNGRRLDTRRMLGKGWGTRKCSDDRLIP